MNINLKEFIKDFNFAGDIKEDSIKLLAKYQCSITLEHSLRVAKKCEELAGMFGVNKKSAKIAGYLHDISVIVPNDKKLELCRALGIKILEEEEQFPMILHQKLSKVIAKEMFNIDDINILNAIECHTTLRANGTKLDMILFISDKLEWDQKDIPPYLEEVKMGLDKSLKLGVFNYIRYMWNNRTSLKVIHPWLREAYFFYRGELRGEN